MVEFEARIALQSSDDRTVEFGVEASLRLEKIGIVIKNRGEITENEL